MEQPRQSAGSSKYVCNSLLCTALFDIALLTVLLSVILPLANRLTEFRRTAFTEKETAEVEMAVKKEQSRVLGEAKEVARVAEEQRLFETDDRNRLFETMENERKRRNVELLTLIDERGIAIVRSGLEGAEGEYLFHTTSYGNRMSTGETVSSFDKTPRFPLVLIGGYPILTDGKVKGGVTSGFVMDDKYAALFKEDYLSRGTHIAFYSATRGVVGASFEDKKIRNEVTSIFNAGNTIAEWFRNYHIGQSHYITLGGLDYLVRSITFAEPRGSTGGALIFIPYTRSYESTGAAFVTLLFLLLAAGYLHSRHRDNPRNFAVLTIICVFIFAALFYGNRMHIKRGLIEIKRPGNAIYNSTLELRPAGLVFSSKYEQTVAVKLFAEEFVNAVQVALEYDPSMVQVRSIDVTRSFCKEDLLIERSVNNEKGEAVISCGIPNPGFKGQNATIAEFIIRPIREGTFTLKFAENTKILANDGLGTNVLRVSTGGTYTAVKETKPAARGGPTSVLVFSRSHPNSEQWYFKRDAEFSWSDSESAEYSMLFNHSPNSRPTGELLTKLKSRTFKADGDGIFYFHIRTRHKNQYGPVSHYKVKVDSEPPSLDIGASQTNLQVGDVVRLEWSGADRLSGLQAHYYMKVDNGIFLPASSPVFVPFTEAGEHTVTIRAFDLAGNFRDRTVPVHVEGKSFVGQIFIDLTKFIQR